MSNRRPHFVILCGEGLNCEKESAFALNLAGADTSFLHVHDFLSLSKSNFDNFQGLIIPGGFSFGDELGAGQILYLKIKNYLSEQFFNWLKSNRPLLGICNGFQVLLKLGVFTDFKENSLCLKVNTDHKFIDGHSRLNINPKSTSPWMSMTPSKVSLPVRNKEGRFFCSQADLAQLQKSNQIALRYEHNLNESIDSIAGITNENGLALGLMPHPEACLFKYQQRSKINRNISTKDILCEYGDGYSFFSSIVNYFNNY